MSDPIEFVARFRGGPRDGGWQMGTTREGGRLPIIAPDDEAGPGAYVPTAEYVEGEHLYDWNEGWPNVDPALNKGPVKEA